MVTSTRRGSGWLDHRSGVFLVVAVALGAISLMTAVVQADEALLGTAFHYEWAVGFILATALAAQTGGREYIFVALAALMLATIMIAFENIEPAALYMTPFAVVFVALWPIAGLMSLMRSPSGNDDDYTHDAELRGASRAHSPG